MDSKFSFAKTVFCHHHPPSLVTHTSFPPKIPSRKLGRDTKLLFPPSLQRPKGMCSRRFLDTVLESVQRSSLHKHTRRRTACHKETHCVNIPTDTLTCGARSPHSSHSLGPSLWSALCSHQVGRLGKVAESL